MTPRGLIKLTAIANNIEAWRDWSEVALKAANNGMGDLVLKYQPPSEAGWRRIDQQRKRLVAAMVKRGFGA